LNNRKSHNSILFLTTLGVYLGLVLVGATPQTFAQSSLRNDSGLKRDKEFVCRNNGLINDERQEDIEPFNYDLAKRIIELIEATSVRLEFVKLSEPETLNSYSFFFRQIEFAPYLDSKNKLVDYDWKDKSSAWSSAAQAGQISELHSLFLNPLSDCVRPSYKKLVLNSSDLKIDENGLVLKLTVTKASKQRAAELADLLSELRRKRIENSDLSSVKAIYSSTDVTSEHNQVFIVTRLPRAGLDSLLAKSAK
jgi:hypothetical protein